MELRQLEHFVAVAETRHFTRAAGELTISQSGLSASVRALERELHTTLFVRNTRRVDLTEAGHALLAESRRILAGAAAAREAVAAADGLLRGTLHVGAEQCIGVIDVPALLARFRAAYPGVEIQLRQSGSMLLLEELQAGRLDVAFVATSGRLAENVELLPLATEPMVLVCHPDHRLAKRREISVAQLQDETFVDFETTWGIRDITDRALNAAHVKHDVTLEVNDVHTLLDLVWRRLGVALVPAPIAAKKAAKLATVPLRPGNADRWHIAVAVPAPGAMSLAAQALLNLLPGKYRPALSARGSGRDQLVRSAVRAGSH